ncbi:MAG: hypothetical protein M3432_06365 [Chloroflexota bacterium]|nr:hypothetical protein [Chloroflexota bacterium]
MERGPRRDVVLALSGLAIFALLAVITADHAAHHGHPEAWLALAAVPAGLSLWRRPVLVGLAIALGGFWLRMAFTALPETADQLIVGRAALDTVVAGGNPYGIGYAASEPPGSPYVYGPLALLTSALRAPGEALAAAGTMALLALTRSFLTLGIFGGFIFVVQLGSSGINDLVPGFLLTGGLVALEHHRISGATLLALAAAVKPYCLAWFPAAMGYGGVTAAVALLGLTGVLWSPLLAWGPASFLRSVEMAATIHPVPENSLNIPTLRILAVPLALASFVIRRWSLMVLSGAAIFLVVLFLDRWASYGYWLVVLPILGMLAERWLRERAMRSTPLRPPSERLPSAG